MDAHVCGIANDRPVLRFCDGTEIAVERTRHSGDVDVRVGARVGVCLRPESLSLTDDRAAIPGVVAAVEYAGFTTVCRVATAFGTVHLQVPRSLACPNPGEQVRMNVHASALHLIGTEHQP